MSYIKKYLQEKQEKKQALEQLLNDKKISLNYEKIKTAYVKVSFK